MTTQKATDAVHPNAKREDSLLCDFRQPSLTLRGAPFWSWNDRLKVDELARQVRDMKAHGMGGFFMHSREGLETVYMGPEWLECIRETVRVAQEEGMSAWLYDEDRWPSGAAGGLVPARGGDAFRAKVLTVEECAALPQDMSDVLVLFAVTLHDGHLGSVRRLREQPSLKSGEVCLVFRREVSGPSEWFNEDAYSDNLNPDAVAAFIDITYEAYRKEVGQEFGKAVPGIFTDEPNIANATIRSGRRALPWTDGLPDYFRARRGYDVLDTLPWLFYTGEGTVTAKARHDYWYTISQRFTEAYSKQLGEWCERNGLAFTGHYLYEHEMGNGILHGGAIMPHYRHQQVPGIDMLCEQSHEFLTIKQCSSVANQFGRKQVLSELYGCTGWEFTFEGQKWVGDWHYVLGVNLRCQHLALYTLRGCRKRDYPPAFNYNTTWWKYNSVVEDYFARIGRMLTEGDAVRDIVLLHPVATGWSMLGEGVASKQAVNAYSERLNDFAQAVLATHYDFDFGDEQILASDARLEEKQLVVGRAPYQVVVVPPDTHTLLASTVDLLERFVAAGGKVIAVEPLPAMIEAVASERLAKLWKHSGVTVLRDASALNTALEAVLPRRISLVTPQGQQAARLLYMQRCSGDRSIYFIVNNDRQSPSQTEIALAGSGRLQEWDPLTGETRRIAATQHDGALHFTAEFPPAGSRLYVVDASQAFESQPSATKPWDIRGNISPSSFIGPATAFTRTDPNVLTLDTCQYRSGDAAWSETMDVWRAQDQIRKSLGMRENYRNRLPQRYKWAINAHPKDGAPFEMRFRFSVRDVPTQPVFLLVEGAAQFAITLNGESVANTAVGWYLDCSFHQVALPALKSGENELILGCAYTNHMEIEDCFILGDFAVTPDRVIVAEPKLLHFGDWTTQGYLHYAGSMIYHGQVEHRAGETVRVRLGDYRAVHVAVFANGKLAGHIPWQAANARGVDITACLVPGINSVDIEVVSSPRNMLGPLHLAPGHEAWTEWSSFRRTDETFTPDYVVQSWGLIGQVRLERGTNRS